MVLSTCTVVAFTILGATMHDARCTMIGGRLR
jgi:hypothetical protein